MQYIDEKSIQSFEKVDISSWESMCDNVFVRLINKKYVNKYNDNIATKDFLDLSICVSLQEKRQNTLKSYLFTENDFKRYHIDFNEALEKAMRNTENERGKRILTLNQFMCMHHPVYPLMIDTKSRMAVGTDNSQQPIGFIGGDDENDNILMLCNKKDTYASAYMSSFNILDEVFHRFGNTNFYILPVSVLCVMCVKSTFVSNNNKKPIKEVEEDLLDMVEEINDEKKEWKKILSYKIYYYCGDDNKHLISIK